ncbi:ATP-binding protein [Streptomyces sp. NPDC047072]|uniref:DEAD/DEAH box helicase n=1 Tax=Streptomyces sp. NPDC047072 TaxID=3154809 RepID=UPI0034109E97
MHRRTVELPDPLVLFARSSLERELAALRAQRGTSGSPGSPGPLPKDVHDLAADLGRRGAVPTTVEDRWGRVGDRCLLVHGRDYVARLCLDRRRRNAYEVRSVRPLGLERHHEVAEGCLLVRPVRWQSCHLRGEVPRGSRAHWDLLAAAWQRLVDERAARAYRPALTDRHSAFLAGVERLVDAGEDLALARADAVEEFPYRSVSATGERRHGTRAVYAFRLVGDRRPDEGAFVAVVGEPGQRGRVLPAPAPGGPVTVSFDRALAWESVPAQGALLVTAGQAVHTRQRAALRTLRERRSANPYLLDVLVDHRLRPSAPSADAPVEHLDPDQTEAFRKALAVEDLLVVLGPPGTGKTRVIGEIARTIAASRTGARVLVASHTNRAVDNVLGRLPEDLVVVRVGNENAVTSEGLPYLLEEQAAGLRQGVLDRLRTRLDRPFDAAAVEEGCRELGREVAELRDLLTIEAAALRALDAARRAVGGPAPRQVDRLVAQGAKLARKRHRVARRIERLTSADRAAPRMARLSSADRAAPPPPGRRLLRAPLRVPLRALHRLRARLDARRLASALATATALDEARARNRVRLQEAEATLEAATRDIPAVHVARTALDTARTNTATCRARAVEAARRCREATAGVEEDGGYDDEGDGVAVPEAPDGDVGEGAVPDAVDRRLFAVHERLTERLPLLAARRGLLAEWRQEVAGAAGQLHTELIRYAHVVAATCIGVAARPELAGVDFDLAVVDEAGQIAVPDLLVPLVRARRAVLVGDHRQLPPYVDAEVRDWARRDPDPDTEALVAASALEQLCAGLPATGVVTLTHQRRMPAAVADFVSAAFYEGRLRTPGPGLPHDARLFRTPMAFVDTARLPADRRSERPARRESGEEHPGYVNRAEAELLVLLAAHYDERGEEWAVIVPYAAQAALVTEALTERTGRPRQVKLNVGTVDSFQGGERDVILYGFTRSNRAGRVGFLGELRRANVAFTRARRQLVLVGDLSTLTEAGDRPFRELARALRAHLSVHGEIRQYREVRALVEGTGREGGAR